MSPEYQVVVRYGKPYLRRKPFTYEKPTLRQQVHQGMFAKVAYDLFDEAKGYRDGLPIVAATVKEELTGKEVPKPARVLELTPYQYVDILMQIERRQVKGEKITLSDILKERNITLKVVTPPVIEIPSTIE